MIHCFGSLMTSCNREADENDGNDGDDSSIGV